MCVCVFWFLYTFKHHIETQLNPPSNDQMPHLQWYQHTIFFHKTGNCWLCAYMHRLGLSHSSDRPWETGPQTPEHSLQCCPTYKDAIIQDRRSHTAEETLGRKKRLCWRPQATSQPLIWTFVRYGYVCEIKHLIILHFYNRILIYKKGYHSAGDQSVRLWRYWCLIRNHG